MSDEYQKGAVKSVKSGLAVVRSTRTGNGTVTPNREYEKTI